MTAEDPTLEALLRAALAGPHAAVARAAIAAAHAALCSAGPPRDPGDPGDPGVARAAAALAALLDGAPVGDAAAGPDEPVPPGTAPPGTAPSDPVRAPAGGGTPLRDVAAAFDADPAVQRFLRSSPTLAGTDDDCWYRLWLAFLRLPPELADHWRDRTRSARPSGPTAPGEEQWEELPGEPEVLMDPAPSFGIPGIRQSPGAAPHPEVSAHLPDAAGHREVRALAGALRFMLDRDPELHHALESRRQSRLNPLADPVNHRELCLDIGYRLDDLAAAPAGTVAALEELRRVDEVLCSVVHRPPAHPQSWWGRFSARSRAALDAAAADLRAAGSEIRIRVPDHGDFAAQRDLLGPQNVACAVPELPDSEVVACLRVWMSTDRDVHPARVVYVRNAR